MWAGCPYHVTHRGKIAGPVFLHESDYLVYLDTLSTNAIREGLRLWAYCLMPHHVHLIVIGENATSMARTIGNTHRRHAQRVNGRQGWTGHLWTAVRYVELNPLRAGLAGNPTDFPWSSAAAHAGRAKDGLLAVERPFPGTIDDWNAWLLEGVDDSQFEAIRLNTTTGRPSGSAEFVHDLERRLGRGVRARPHGRPTLAP